MSFKSGCDISGEVVMTKIQWVQCLILGCDVMREVDVTSKIELFGVIQWMRCHLPGPGIEPASPASAGGFLSTAPLQKSTCFAVFNCMAFYDVNVLS